MSTRAILYTGKQFLISVAHLKNMYTPPGVLNKMKDGTVAYPRRALEKQIGEQDDMGMGFEFRSIFEFYALHQLLALILYVFFKLF
jgi:hypothetical protein